MRRWIFFILFFMLLALVLFYFTEIKHLIKLVQEMHPGWLLAALALQFGTYLLLALVWWWALWWVNERASYLSLVLLSISQLFVNQTVPSSGLSGAVVVTNFLKARKISKKAIGLAIALNVFGRQIAFTLTFMAAVIILWIYRSPGLTYQILGILFALLMFVVTGLFVYLWKLAADAKLPGLLKRFSAIETLFSSIRTIKPSVLLKLQIVSPAVLLFTGIVIFDSLTLWVILYGFNVETHFLPVFAAQVLTTVLAGVSLIPGGLGVFEGGLVGMLHLIGLPFDVSFAATLLFRGFTYWLPMLPGFLITHKQQK
ncbi:YbhN family protein [Legionella genomosp. 1]|uniref:lysylphosphatidylglycerol synthase transmembrane domain-containing protein n=1 Tax=Legionella genomosp. 1 TaxID=1093625 RepID=UPI0013EFB09F|nr:lysylphosphatidylglycerol synthase transmembrane domain-containing protein [Legionella genomosp. 1]